MTEAEWLAATNAQDMVEFLRDARGLGDRKLRLWSCTCVRRIWPLLTDGRQERVVEVSEEFADGLSSPGELADAWQAAEAARELVRPTEGAADQAYVIAAIAPCLCAGRDRLLVLAYDRLTDACYAAVEAVAFAEGAVSEEAWLAAWAGEQEAQSHLLRDVVGNPFRAAPSLAPAVLAWDGGLVVRMANALYEERQFPSGHLDPDLLAVLADALEEAGCADAELLAHLRGPGPHVRGCWAVDAVMRGDDGRYSPRRGSLQ